MFPRRTPAGQGPGDVSHSTFEVRRLVERQPSLARSSWDWGFGDWETPLGAASHMGRRDIAEVLLARGARPTIFSAAMMESARRRQAFIAARRACSERSGLTG
jgi:hypothetical protein